MIKGFMLPPHLDGDDGDCDVITGLEQAAEVTPSPMLRIHLNYARAVLSDDSAACPLYADLMGQDLTRWPWATIGAATWAASARRELGATAAGMQADGSPPPSSIAR
jgi:hypothetical protein